MEVKITKDEQFPIEIILSSGVNKFTKKASIELEQMLHDKNKELLD